MTRRDLTAQLRRAAAAMPPTERLRFFRFLRGLEGRDPPDVVPGTPFLPAVTINRPPAAQPTSRLECNWYYGEDCNCGLSYHRREARLFHPVQLRLL